MESANEAVQLIALELPFYQRPFREHAYAAMRRNRVRRLSSSSVPALALLEIQHPGPWVWFSNELS